jgi:hypothetical protein
MVDPFSPGSKLAGSPTEVCYGPDKGNPCSHLYGLKDEYVGKCIKDYERNGYHDSDFYMVVWDDEKEAPKSICFATTRGWSYPCYGSSPDATPEVMAKYEAYCKEQERRARVRSKWESRKAARKEAKELVQLKADLAVLLKVSPEKASAFVDKEGKDRAIRVKTLFKAKLRSDFRKSMKAQIERWAADPAPKYPSPLSKKQWEYV